MEIKLSFRVWQAENGTWCHDWNFINYDVGQTEWNGAETKALAIMEGARIAAKEIIEEERFQEFKDQQIRDNA